AFPDAHRHPEDRSAGAGRQGNGHPDGKGQGAWPRRALRGILLRVQLAVRGLPGARGHARAHRAQRPARDVLERLLRRVLELAAGAEDAAAELQRRGQGLPRGRQGCHRQGRRRWAARAGAGDEAAREHPPGDLLYHHLEAYRGQPQQPVMLLPRLIEGSLIEVRCSCPRLPPQPVTCGLCPVLAASSSSLLSSLIPAPLLPPRPPPSQPLASLPPSAPPPLLPSWSVQCTRA
ncbi:unnamed protein product, partial [Prorocentrum cordatum]